MSCFSDYSACVKKCQILNDTDDKLKALCIGACVIEFLECVLPRFFSLSASEYIEFDEVTEEYCVILRGLATVARTQRDVLLSQNMVIKPSGVREPFVPFVKISKRLLDVGIDEGITRKVTNTVASTFRDGQTTGDIRSMLKSALALEGEGLVAQFEAQSLE